MLKLIKYDLLGSYRQYLLTYLCYLLLCIATPLLSDIDFVASILMIGLGILMIGLSFSISINLILNFNRSMFKRPGYLTLTLPVSSKQLLLSKIISAMIWVVATILVLLVGFFILILLIANKEGLTLDMMMTVIQIGLEELPISWQDISVTIISSIISLLASIASVYAIVTFTHTKFIKKYRAAIGILIYFLIVMVFSETIGVLLDDMMIDWSAKAVLGFTIFKDIIVFVGSFFLMDYFLTHHLEID